MTRTTHDEQMERYSQPYTGPVEGTSHKFSDQTEDEKAISELLIEAMKARQSLQISQRELAVLERSLGGSKKLSGLS